MAHNNIPPNFTDFFQTTHSISKMMAEYGVCRSTIKKWIKVCGLEEPKSNASLCDQYPHEVLLSDFHSLNVFELEAKYNTSRRRLGVAATVLGFDSTVWKGQKSSTVIAPTEITLRKVISECSSKQEICKRFGITNTVLKRWLREHNITLPKYYGVVVDLDLKQLADCVDRGMSISEIARHFNTSHPTITRRLDALGMPRQKDEWDKLNKRLEEILPDVIKRNETEDILTIAKDYNIVHSTLLKYIKSRGYDIKQHGYNKSKGELEVRTFVEALGFDCMSIKRSFKGLCRELDIFVPSVNVAIEYCGEYWHSTTNKPKNYHKQKLDWCNEQGIQLITIFEHQWKTKRTQVENIIRSKLGLTRRMFARHTNIETISISQAKAFCTLNHMHGSINASVAVGLKHNNVLVGVMTFNKSRFDKDVEWEIGRMCFLNGLTVVGGASKMFSYFVDNYNPKSVISYANRCFGNGGVYKHLGMSFVRDTPPGYFYYHTTNHLILTRYQCQKHKLKSVVDFFDESKSEYDNMTDNGFHRVEDCGHRKFIWKSSSL